MFEIAFKTVELGASGDYQRQRGGLKSIYLSNGILFCSFSLFSVNISHSLLSFFGNTKVTSLSLFPLKQVERIWGHLYPNQNYNFLQESRKPILADAAWSECTESFCSAVMTKNFNIARLFQANPVCIHHCTLTILWILHNKLNWSQRSMF